MKNYSIEEFIEQTAQKDEANHTFELESSHLLEVNLNGKIWTKVGAMIGYTGNIRFTREGMLEHGVEKMFKKMLTGEGASMMKAEGQGRLYLADKGKKVHILDLTNDTLFVNGNDLLAFEDSVKWDIKMMRRVAGMLAGGLFNVEVSGSGMIAITTHYEPITPQVTPGQPVFTDPNATVAWSGSLSPELKTDISFRTLMGRGSGEAFQMKFQGSGWVVLQPFEEVHMAAGGGLPT
jgi:uncharacterized protein (AIM24 family)